MTYEVRWVETVKLWKRAYVEAPSKADIQAQIEGEEFRRVCPTGDALIDAEVYLIENVKTKVQACQIEVCLDKWQDSFEEEDE